MQEKEQEEGGQEEKGGKMNGGACAVLNQSKLSASANQKLMKETL